MGMGRRNTWKIDVWMWDLRSVYLQTLREGCSPETVQDFLSFYDKPVHLKLKAG